MHIYDDYEMTNSSPYNGTSNFSGLAVLSSVMTIIMLIILIILIISLFKIFKKNNKPGWFALIPILNVWTFFEICGYKGFFSIIPFVNMIFMLMSLYKIAIVNGKKTIIGIITLFFPYIGLPIIAFTKNKENNENNIVNNQTNNINANNLIDKLMEPESNLENNLDNNSIINESIQPDTTIETLDENYIETPTIVNSYDVVNSPIVDNIYELHQETANLPAEQIIHLNNLENTPINQSNINETNNNQNENQI